MNEQPAPKPARVRWRTWAALLLPVVVVALAAAWLQWRCESLLAAAETSLKQNRPEEALRLSRKAISCCALLDRVPLVGRNRAARGWLIACRAHLKLEDYAAGVEALRHVPLGDSPDVLDAYCESASALVFHLNSPSNAERLYRDVLRVSPRHPAAVEGLADLLGLSARRWEAIPYLVDVIRRGQFRVEHLTLLAAENGAHPSPDLWKRWLEDRPNDPLGHLAWAWHTADTGDRKKVLGHVRRAIELNPQLAEAHALLGSLLLKDGRLSEVQDWHANLPEQADDFPAIWALRAQWAQRCGETSAAIRCYAEAVKRNPSLPDANYQLGQLLHALDKPSLAAPFLEQSQKLQELSARESVLLHSEHTSLEPIRRFADQLVVLGRVWEAWGWSQLAGRIDPREQWPRRMQAELAGVLASDPPWTLEAVNPVIGFGIEEYALPDWDSIVLPAVDATPPLKASPSADARIRFRESAAEVGLNFQYFNSSDPATPGQYMYEFSGGGVGVLDYDLDGWPDLHLTQGCRWPHDPSDDRHLDKLFRNLGGRQFEDVTGPARIAENGYSQGVAVGDFNSDGMPDLYVANIGRNTLYVNNGDGTFSDVSPAIDFDDARWTTSCLLADLDGDGFADLYDVNYLSGPDVFERLCYHKDGVARMCAPFDFPAASDQFYRNSGDGSFRESTSAAGFDVDNGKGLGIVAADFEGSGRLSLIIANDLVANFFFRSETGTGGGALRFVEEGLERGIAFDAGGRAQGSMGIAVGDATGDQRLDVFVTNFLMEPNAFYTQLSDGFFSDEIHRSGMYHASMQQLGFGTQFIDGDLDGRLDLIVTNGHIDDHRDYGRPYHMPPQFFHNVGEGRFRELAPETLGPFFSGAYLGRGLARLDWNRDGLEDVAISHLDAPAALLTNVTAAHGRFLAVRLVAVDSHRDAIGAAVSIHLGGETIMQQLTAGDGYQASNQRQLVFGLGDQTQIDAVEVRWPSGKRQRFEGVPADRELLIVEGAEQPFSIPH